MRALHRHRLVGLSDAGWRAARAAFADAPAAFDCLALWHERRLPLVVARQDGVGVGVEVVRLGLPAPAMFGRQRLTLQVAPRDLLDAGEFPGAAQVVDLLPPSAWTAWCRIVDALAPFTQARVFGSFGWQRLTALPYVHADSDIDLLLPVADAAAADVVATILAEPWAGLPRLDGELVFASGDAVAWREWRQWRARAVDAMLVKRIDGVRLEDEPGWLDTPAAVADRTAA